MNFLFFELTEVIRQKNEFRLIKALNNLAIGEMTSEDIELINSRIVNENEVPESAIRLFAENIQVDECNSMKVKAFPGISTIFEAKNHIIGKFVEVGINCYNEIILHLFESNMDFQFVSEEFSLASYIINYISEVEAGLSKLSRDAANDILNGNLSIKEKFRKIANIFINGNLMSTQEAGYHAVSLALSKSSRRVIFINTSKINERICMLKKREDLKEMNENSNEIYMKNFVEKYVDRAKKFEHVCLADFVSNYTKRNDFSDDDNDNDDDFVTIMQENL